MKILMILAVMVVAIAGLADWRDRNWKTQHLNGTQVRLECPPQKDGVPSPCVLHVAMPDIDHGSRVIGFKAARKLEEVDLVMEYSGRPYRWEYKSPYADLVATARLERNDKVLATVAVVP